MQSGERVALTPGALPSDGRRRFQFGPGGKADFGEAQEDDAENRVGVFLGLEAGVGAELVGGIPEAFSQGFRDRVFFRWSDPVHDAGTQGISNRFSRKARK